MKLKTMLLVLLIILLVAVLLVLPVAEAAGDSTDSLLEFENFEGYGDNVGGAWVSQGASGSAPLVSTQYGSSAVLTSTASNIQELFVTVESSMPSVITGFSLRLCDFNAKRAYHLKGSTGGFEVLTVEKNGAVKISDTDTGITLSTDKWYKFIVEYSLDTGFVRIKCTDGITSKIVEGESTSRNVGEISRITFISRKSTDEDAVAYIDDCWSYALPYDTVPFAQDESVIDFEDFTARSDGQLPPTGWRQQNNAVGATLISTETFDTYSKTMKLWSDGSKHYEVFYTCGRMSDEVIYIEFDLRRTPNSYLTLELIGFDSSNQSSRAKSLIAISGDGELTMSGTATGKTLDENVWYSTQMIVNLSEQTYTISFTNGDNTVSGSGEITADISALNEFKFYLPKSSGNQSCVYADNLSIHTPRKSAVRSFSPSFGNVDISTSEITVSIDGDFTEDALVNCDIRVNGSTNAVARRLKNGNDIIITLANELDYDGFYFVEIADLVATDNTVINTANAYYTGSGWTVYDFSFSADALSGGQITASVTVESETDEISDATLILALYSKTTNEMLSITFDTASISSGSSERLSCGLNVADSEDELELVAYIWDSFDKMTILGTSSILD